MKTFKKKALFMALLLGSMALTACGGGKSSTSSESKKSENSQSQSVAPGSDSASDESNASADASADVSESSSSSKSKKKRSSSMSEDEIAKLPEFDVKIDAKDGTDPVTSKIKYSFPITKPADPTAPAGKKFYGWMNVENGGQIWDFEDDYLNAVTQKTTLEPLFVDANLDPQVLEAELCPEITHEDGGRGMDGNTYSGGQKGKGLIYSPIADGDFNVDPVYFEEDDGDVRYATAEDPAGEKFGAAVHFLYVYGNKLTWKVNSSAAAENVTIFMKISAEYGHENGTADEVYCDFDDQMVKISVNGTRLEYGAVTIHRVIPKEFIPFQDYLLSTTVSLNAGENTIEYLVDNQVTLNGTIASSGPCIDCLKVYSSSQLTFTNAEWENLVAD